jgi:hypothetical protein
MKFVHNLQPIGANKVKLQHDQDNEAASNCPCCHAHIETQLHMLQCTLNPARVKASIAAITSATKKGEGTN